MKFLIKEFLSVNVSNLLKKSLMGNFIFCAVQSSVWSNKSVFMEFFHTFFDFFQIFLSSETEEIKVAICWDDVLKNDITSSNTKFSPQPL